MDLAALIHRVAGGLPGSERFGLSEQLRRSAVSVPSNIAEGSGRRGRAEFARFLAIAQGSLCEVETQLLLCSRLGIGSRVEIEAALDVAAQVGRLVSGLRRSLRERSGA